MIRPQKISVRPVYNPSSVNETIQSSNNVGDIASYIGKSLTINHQQFIVEDVLGQGGFAFVFLVRSYYNQQRYALKRMYVNNQRDLNICQREISFVKEFSLHRNIIKYVDSYIHCLSRSFYENNNDDDDIYEILLLTEYCSNGALINRLNEQRNLGITLNERQILRIFADICSAVSACHFHRPQPILHRDIKLENILIDSHQNYILCDFGSAIQLSSSTTNGYQQYQTNQLTTNIIQQLEEEIQRYTTLSYRAPEMVDLYSRLPITLKVDIWAMGCLLYKLMYNIMPFGESILAIQNGTFVIPDDMSHIYSRELNLFVRYMLEIDINKRPDIWQVSYMTYKLIGNECPIPNRCNSKIPDLNGISMPLKDSESRHQRTVKSTSKTPVNESLSLGTAVNPRERPRGMPSSTSLLNFSQTNQQRSPAVVAPLPPPPQQQQIPSSSSSNHTRSGSAAQLMFEDDFSKIPSHAISLTNIPTVTTTTKTEQNLSRARPSPVSTASGFALQQKSFLPPPSSSNAYGHRRSSSQTISPTNNQQSFHNASSVDSSNQNEIFNDGQTSSSGSDDDKSISQNNQKMKSKNHHPSTEEAKKVLSFTNKYPRNESTIVQSANFNDNSNTGFDQLVNEDSDDKKKATKNEHNNRINPFLRAPFHHSSINKQTSVTTFDANSIVMGKRTSAFTPYQKQEINSIHSNKLSSSTDVFTNAPFKTKSKAKQHSTINEQTKTMINDIQPKQNICNCMADEYF